MADDNITPEERREIDEARASAKADSTIRRYDSAMKSFSEWLIDRGESDELPISPGLVLVYLLKRSDKYKKKTLNLDVSAIKHAHESAGFPSPSNDPEVKELMQGIARRKKGEGVKQAPGLTRQGLARIEKTACLPRPRGRGKGKGMETESTALKRGLTDIALLRTQSDGMMRISEALDLLWGDIQYNPDRNGSGTATIRSSKTDQEGIGADQWLSPGTMAALEAIRPSEYQPDDRIFKMTPPTAGRRIRQAGIAAGLEVNLTGHSARVGMTQELVKAGIHVAAIMKAGRWSSGDMVPYYSRNILAGEGAVAQYHKGVQNTPVPAYIYRPPVAVRAPVWAVMPPRT